MTGKTKCRFNSIKELDKFVKFMTPIFYEYCAEHPGLAYDFSKHPDDEGTILEISLFKY